MTAVFLSTIAPMASEWGHIWHDGWRIVTAVIVLFLIIAWWNWLLSNFGTF